MLFDLDGTLTDPYPGISAGIVHVCRMLGRPEPNVDVLRSMIGPPFQETFTEVLGIAHDQVDDAIGVYRSVYETGGLYDASVYDGISASLACLHNDGHVLALATSKPTESATRVLQYFGLDRWFAFIGGAARDGTRHHKADVIGHVLESVATKRNGQRVVMVGDRRYDIEGARAHGLSAVGVSWGYADPGELVDAGAERIVHHPSELIDL